MNRAHGCGARETQSTTRTDALSHLIGEVCDEVLRAVVVVMDGQPDVTLVEQNEERHSVRYQHVAPDVKLLLVKQKRICDVPVLQKE